MLQNVFLLFSSVHWKHENFLKKIQLQKLHEPQIIFIFNVQYLDGMKVSELVLNTI